ncbi:MAG: hypothetical protein AAFQ94_31435 [Bacteroidota bacterium]
MQKEENIMDFDLNDPPKGTWFRYEMNNLIVGASTRSAAAFFLVPFMIIWSGGSLGGIYGTQILNDEFDIVLSLFGLPFLVGSILFWGITLMTIAGKTEVTLNRYDGRVFTGIGKIGITKKFDWEEIEGVSMTTTRGRNGKDVKTICLEAPKDIKFGSALKKDRKYYLYQAVKSVYKKVSFGNSI